MFKMQFITALNIFPSDTDYGTSKIVTNCDNSILGRIHLTHIPFLLTPAVNPTAPVTRWCSGRALDS